jgi:hypothetical protein
MRTLVTAALAALAIAAAGAAFAADSPATTHRGPPAAVGSDLAGAGIGKPGSGGGIGAVAGPRCPNRGVFCGKTCLRPGQVCHRR